MMYPAHPGPLPVAALLSEAEFFPGIFQEDQEAKQAEKKQEAKRKTYENVEKCHRHRN
ncbi:MAG: hypothetical protein WD708_12475 [Kiritimatiellia bacterium]